MKQTYLIWMLAIVFLVSGSAKLLGLNFEIVAFERWGYPKWFMYLTGVLEVMGALGLLIPRLTSLSSACLALLMIGAVWTHLVHSEWPMMAFATVIMITAAITSWMGLFKKKKES
jgi:putative oxidoreductase